MTRLSKVNKPGLLFYVAAIIVLATLTTIFPSCAKDPGKIGTIVQPDDSWLKVRYSDTSTVFAHSVLIDSVRSDELTRNSVGYINDPVFGATKASFATKFLLSESGHSFGESPQFDSLVIQLVYTGAYGDTNTTLTLHTYLLDSPFYRDSVYFSNKVFDHDAFDYSNYSFMPRPHDSVHFDGDTLAPLIRMNLSNISESLGTKLLGASTTEMEDNDAFQDFFKGLYITPSTVSTEGALAYFDLTLTLSRMTIYYRNGNDTLEYNYVISTSTARVNKYEHDYTNASAQFKQQVINGDTTLGNQVFYTQGYGGVKTLIRIPYPTSWRNLKNVAINEAKLVLPGGDYGQFYGEPARLALVKILEDGTYDFLPDQYEGDNYFGGYYSSSSNKYEFRITRYIQSIISDSTQVDYGLYLFVNSGSVNPESYIFNGPHPVVDTARRIKLEILYTDLD